MPQTPFPLGSRPLPLPELLALWRAGTPLALADEARTAVQACRRYLESKLDELDTLYYGINTGFGALCDLRISRGDLTALQHNLVRSHAAGAGRPVPRALVRLILLLKIKNLSYGYSGVRPLVLDRLIALYNAGLLPVLYEFGSLGASGDLAPLAHLSLPLLGEGELWWEDAIVPAAPVLARHAIVPVELAAKEGLALLNGTQFSTAYAAYVCGEGRRLLEVAARCAALSTDVFGGSLVPFDERLHAIRPHAGQVAVARRVRALLADSALQQRPRTRVQDPYAFRCVPQVHGATADTLAHAERVVETEINAVTDNPNLFVESDGILSGGNFHAQPIALVLDFLAIALAELGSISERRTYQLLSGPDGLPLFLSSQPGLRSGLMIAQYTAASIVSRNKQLCTPASVDSIVSSNGQEDHVSMAANAATKAYDLVHNLWQILAIEWMTAVQALHFRRPGRSGGALEAWVADYRRTVPALETDRALQPDIAATVRFLKGRAFAE